MAHADLGPLDRRIGIERPVASEEYDGEATWESIGEMWATVEDVLPSRGERVAQVVSIASRPARIRLRWRGDITSDMRIVYGVRVMQIVAGPAEIGRQDGIELMAQDYSTAGNTA